MTEWIPIGLAVVALLVGGGAWFRGKNKPPTTPG